MDKILIVSTLALLVVGIVMVYSSSSIMASNKFGDEYFFVKKHLVFALGGLVLFVVASKV
ncbi:MAG: FtsW/RodA/SpoVE family cell cycle protein, partial [Proteobacteria bacterium]|nr:FtsW/RodA/SpoVE family cell cycle protein [Pseudomonadota bacterium]